jgi:hypothetical protein
MAFSRAAYPMIWMSLDGRHNIKFGGVGECGGNKGVRGSNGECAGIKVKWILELEETLASHRAELPPNQEARADKAQKNKRRWRRLIDQSGGNRQCQEF